MECEMGAGMAYSSSISSQVGKEGALWKRRPLEAASPSQLWQIPAFSLCSVNSGNHSSTSPNASMSCSFLQDRSMAVTTIHQSAP